MNVETIRLPVNLYHIIPTYKLLDVVFLIALKKQKQQAFQLNKNIWVKKVLLHKIN